MKCKYCKEEIEVELKYIAYYSTGKPIYWQLCDSCMRNMRVKYKATLQEGRLKVLNET